MENATQDSVSSKQALHIRGSNGKLVAMTRNKISAFEPA
jgi:hypothetical protein